MWTKNARKHKKRPHNQVRAFEYVSFVQNGKSSTPSGAGGAGAGAAAFVVFLVVGLVSACCAGSGCGWGACCCVDEACWLSSRLAPVE